MAKEYWLEWIREDDAMKGSSLPGGYTSLKEARLAAAHYWNRVKPGLYRLSNGNYEVIKKGTEWNVYWYDLWNGKKTLIHVADTYSEGKKFAIRHHDKMQKDAIKRLGR